jgi:4'-phosphopantetheinyl transferase EntD
MGVLARPTRRRGDHRVIVKRAEPFVHSAPLSMIETLLPPEVASVAVCGDDPSSYLLEQEAIQIGKPTASRLREFTTARTCARRALIRLGLAESPIPCGLKREPIWPRGVVGSITHCRGYRAAAVAMQCNILTIGIDAELHEPLPPEVLTGVATPEERSWLQCAPAGVHWDRLLFSAKENVYKAWFPLTRDWLGFQDAQVTFIPGRGLFYAKLLVLPPMISGFTLDGFAGRFLIRDGFVLTAIALPQRHRQAIQQGDGKST